MKRYRSLIKSALKEDAAHKDITTQAAIPVKGVIRAELTAKQSGVICGMPLLQEVFCTLNTSCMLQPFVKDGDRIKPGQILAIVNGPSRAILSAERTALNFIQHLSGIATLTSMFVEKAKGTKARILDTRKTLPGLRELEKYAVRCGGGYNHRMNLEEMALIKDNHVRMVKDVRKLVADIRKKKPRVRVEIECQSLDEIGRAVEAGADIIMLDNMDAPSMRKAIALIRKAGGKRGKGPLIEVSGGVNLDTVREFAKLGVDRISVGAITHSAPALDISLEIVSM